MSKKTKITIDPKVEQDILDAVECFKQINLHLSKDFVFILENKVNSIAESTHELASKKPVLRSENLDPFPLCLHYLISNRKLHLLGLLGNYKLQEQTIEPIAKTTESEPHELKIYHLEQLVERG